jgi:hypothetical protein
MEFVMVGTREVGFHLGYWFFAYKYWMSSLQMECLFRNNTVFEAALYTKIVGYVFLVSNILLPLIFCTSAGYMLF